VIRRALEVGLDLGPRDHRPGRVVRVAEVDDLRPRTDLGQDALDVVAVAGQRHALRLGAQLDRVEHVAGKRRPAADDLVARVEDGEGEVHDDCVGAGGEGYVLEANAVLLRERRAQPVRTPVGIAVELGRAARDRLERFGKRAELALI
jgi:hypothetical protein